jgi:hypothetical protein
MYHVCQECQELWLQYGLATTVHVQLENKLRLMALQSDTDRIRSLTLETEFAEELRSRLRRAINEHEQSHRASFLGRTTTAG